MDASAQRRAASSSRSRAASERARLDLARLAPSGRSLAVAFGILAGAFARVVRRARVVTLQRAGRPGRPSTASGGDPGAQGPARGARPESPQARRRRGGTNRRTASHRAVRQPRPRLSQRAPCRRRARARRRTRPPGRGIRRRLGTWPRDAHHRRPYGATRAPTHLGPEERRPHAWASRRRRARRRRAGGRRRSPPAGSRAESARSVRPVESSRFDFDPGSRCDSATPPMPTSSSPSQRASSPCSTRGRGHSM